MWTSQTIGGLLNATLGNMVEVCLNSHPFNFCPRVVVADGDCHDMISRCLMLFALLAHR
jgi:hypothetical protein